MGKSRRWIGWGVGVVLGLLGLAANAEPDPAKVREAMKRYEQEAESLKPDLPPPESLPKPQDVVEYRKAVYTVAGWNFKPIGAMVKGEIPFDAAAVARHAQYVALMSQAAPEGFAKGSGPDAVKDTEAKPEIWTNPDKFKTAMSNFQQESAKLVEVAKAGKEADIKAQFVKTAETCKACHKEFKKD